MLSLSKHENGFVQQALRPECRLIEAIVLLSTHAFLVLIMRMPTCLNSADCLVGAVWLQGEVLAAEAARCA